MRQIVQVTPALPLNSEEPTATLKKIFDVRAQTSIQTLFSGCGKAKERERYGQSLVVKYPGSNLKSRDITEQPERATFI
ncbi:hypothetical protein PoB_002669900 [Plakobranchus ocellatus]|uniref:Uncharacterized protein n=1 Tax=Plakobranchus ocellatus TaxID=259542 RepID=A0AAV4A1V9_9GAST|nr:hypothetical protein PoB_002669900 [Plakobranchus ocellatus]